MTEISLRLGYVQHCIADDTGSLYPYLCTAPNLQDRVYKANQAAPGTKCVGPNGKRANGVSRNN